MVSSLVLVSSAEFKSENEATLFLNAWSNLSKIITDCVMRHLVRNTKQFCVMELDEFGYQHVIKCNVPAVIWKFTWNVCPC